MDMDRYYPYNAIAGDRLHDADDLAQIIRALFSDGVVMVAATDLQVQAATAFSVTVKAGTCIVGGRIGVNLTDKTVTVAAPYVGLNRIDRIVARADYANRKTTIQYLQGEPASTPVAPTLKDDADGFDLLLAQIAVSNSAVSIGQDVITDERVMAAPLIPSSLAALLAQQREALRVLRVEEQAEFVTWFQELEVTLSGEQYANLMNLLNEYRQKTYQFTVPTSAWALASGDMGDRYEATVSVAGVVESRLDADVVLDDSVSTARTQLQAWNYVNRIDVTAGTVKLTCYDYKPLVDLNVVLKAVK